MKLIQGFEIIIHGIYHEQYFPGCGCAFTSFTDVATGIGESAHEAAEDALELLSQNEWNVDKNKSLLRDVKRLSRSVGRDLGDNCYFYVSIKVK